MSDNQQHSSKKGPGTIFWVGAGVVGTLAVLALKDAAAWNSIVGDSNTATLEFETQPKIGITNSGLYFTSNLQLNNRTEKEKNIKAGEIELRIKVNDVVKVVMPKKINDTKVAAAAVAPLTLANPSLTWEHLGVDRQTRVQIQAAATNWAAGIGNIYTELKDFVKASIKIQTTLEIDGKSVTTNDLTLF